MPPRQPPQQPPGPPVEITNLFNAIDSATPDRLRAVLKTLSTRIPGALPLVQSELLLKQGELKRAAPWGGPGEVSSEESSDDSDDGSEDPGNDYESDYSDEGGRPEEASRQRFEICNQCNKEYDVLSNGKKSCRWHDGDLEVDWDGDFWADHDERCHGEIDTEEMRKEYPDGFMWDCCEQTGDMDGCQRSRHRPNRSKRVRRLAPWASVKGTDPASYNDVIAPNIISTCASLFCTIIYASMDLANILSPPQKVLAHSNIEMESNKTTQPLQPDMQYLFDAIDSATEIRVRSLLRAVCQERQEAFDYIGERLLLRRGDLKRAAPWETNGTREEDDYEYWDSEDGVEKNEEKDNSRLPDTGIIGDSDYSDEEIEEVLSSQKRKGVFSRQRFEVCGQCDSEYDVLQNGKKSCRWRSGESKVDWETGFWNDHDERTHGKIDDEGPRITYPEGFRRTCCDKLHNGRGCKMVPHRPDRAKRVRRL